MYIIGSKSLFILVVFLTLVTAPISAKAASDLEISDDTSQIGCLSEPKFPDPYLQLPNWNRPFAFNQSMQKVSGVFGIDISRWDHPSDKLLNFRKIRESGYEFAFIKLSDGATAKADQIAAKWWRIDRPAATQAGMRVGGYHYAYPSGNSSNQRYEDALIQARKASIRYGTWSKGRLPLVLDFEHAPSGWTPRDLTTWALVFLNEAQRLTKTPPMLYTYSKFIMKHMYADLELANYPLWIAHYGRHLTEPVITLPWSAKDGWANWQFSSSGRTPGTHRNVGDLNVMPEHWYQKLTGQKTDYEFKPTLGRLQALAIRSAAEGVLTSQLHQRTGGTLDGALAWYEWSISPNKCLPGA